MARCNRGCNKDSGSPRWWVRNHTLRAPKLWSTSSRLPRNAVRTRRRRGGSPQVDAAVTSPAKGVKLTTRIERHFDALVLRVEPDVQLAILDVELAGRRPHVRRGVLRERVALVVQRVHEVELRLGGRNADRRVPARDRGQRIAEVAAHNL